jgi:hypothetical protein
MTQLNVLGDSVEVNEKLAVVWFVGLVGWAVIVVFGAAVSTVKLTEPDPVLLAASVAVTTTLCVPSVRPVYAFGLVQLDAAPASIAHVVVYGATPPETPNVMFTFPVLKSWPGVGELIATVGPVVLMTHV